MTNYVPQIWAKKLYEETLLRHELYLILGTIIGGLSVAKTAEIPSDMDPRDIKIRVGEMFKWKGHYLSRMTTKVNGYSVRLSTTYRRFPNLELKQAIDIINKYQAEDAG